MPALENPKWENFAQAVALGMSATEAYRQHVSRGKCANTTAEVEGCKMSKSPKIAQRILELREKVAAKIESKFNMTKDKWLEKLAGIANDAHQTGDFSAATGALTQIGKAADFYAAERLKTEGQLEIIIRKE